MSVASGVVEVEPVVVVVLAVVVEVSVVVGNVGGS